MLKIKREKNMKKYRTSIFCIFMKKQNPRARRKVISGYATHIWICDSFLDMWWGISGYVVEICGYVVGYMWIMKIWI